MYYLSIYRILPMSHHSVAVCLFRSIIVFSYPMLSPMRLHDDCSRHHFYLADPIGAQILSLPPTFHPNVVLRFHGLFLSRRR
jgi:hypothetical protein